MNLTPAQKTLPERMGAFQPKTHSDVEITCHGTRQATRFLYDTELCPRRDGWVQFDTVHNSVDFGIW